MNSTKTLKILRVERNMMLIELAAQVGIKMGRLHAIEDGREIPTQNEMDVLTRFYGCDIKFPDDERKVAHNRQLHKAKIERYRSCDINDIRPFEDGAETMGIPAAKVAEDQEGSEFLGKG